MPPHQQCSLRNLHENSLIISKKKITSLSEKGSEGWLLHFIFLSDVIHFVSHALRDHHLWENATWNTDEPMNSSWQRSKFLATNNPAKCYMKFVEWKHHEDSY